MDAVVVLADGECPQLCAVRGVTEYISAALAIVWDLTAGYLFPMVDEDGGKGNGAADGPSHDGRTTGAPESGRDIRPVYDALVSGKRIG